jgi:hypothetical protein
MIIFHFLTGLPRLKIAIAIAKTLKIIIVYILNPALQLTHFKIFICDLSIALVGDVEQDIKSKNS